MKRASLFLVLLLALALTVGCAGAEVQWAGPGRSLGIAMPDFTAKTIDGGSFTLSEALKTKDMVLINLWATWCGPCAAEFPAMEEAYEQYQDKVAIIALSVEPTDDNDALAAYAAQYGMTFPVGNDAETNLATYFAVQAIPTSVVVDRFGNVCYIEAGSMPSSAAFIRLFDFFVGDHYTETQVLYDLPPAKPTVDAPDEAALSSALNAAGGAIRFTNPTNEYVWPMEIRENSQGSFVQSTNSNQDASTCAVYAQIEAQAGDYLAFDFETSSEAAMDLLKIYVDDQLVKSFGGRQAWNTWALPLEAGAHQVAFAYEKDDYTADYDDLIRLDNIRLVRDEEAAALLAALPAYPVGDGLALRTEESAREIVFDGDEGGMLDIYFGAQSYWIVDDTLASLDLIIGPDNDPETVFAYTNYDGSVEPFAEDCRMNGLTNGGGTLNRPFGVDSMAETGYPYTTVSLYASANAMVESDIVSILLFADEENANTFVQMLAEQVGLNVTWRYTDGADAASDAVAEGAPAVAEYTVYFTDQNGDPVPGCIINFCTDELCTPCVADENGIATFSGAPYAYHLQVIRVPAGYSFDTTQEFIANEEGGDLFFNVTKD